MRDPQDEGSATLGPEVREALIELQRYLSDSLAPLMVADSVNLLLEYPAELTAGEIQVWTSAQYRGRHASIPVSDYLFHALEKIHMMGQYELVPKDALARYLEDLAQLVMGYCPEDDREMLRGNLARLGQTNTVLASPVEYLRRQVGSEGPLASRTPAGGGGPAEPGALNASMTPEVAKKLRQFSMLMERLESRLGGSGTEASGGGTASGGTSAGGDAAAGGKDAILSQMLRMAATSSGSDAELSTALDQLKRVGMNVHTADIFRALGRALPAWTVPTSAEAADQSGSMSRAGVATAIRRVVTLPEDPAEVARRFHEMLLASVEEFNKGSLARAARMFDVAAKLVVEKKVDTNALEASRKRALEILDFERIKVLGDEPSHHVLLRQVLGFFPALAPARLLADLQVEEKRERRRVLLLLLEIHGPAGRSAALEALQAALVSTPPEEEWHFKRNLLYLLRRIPRSPEQPWDDELDCLIRLSEPGLPSPLVKEAIANLGLVKHEKAEAVLVSRVQGLEQMLEKSDAPFDQAELQPLLDRAVSALARFGTPTARRAVVEHGLKKKTSFGDAAARLGDLAGQNLADDPELVGLLLKNMRSELPFKVLGFTLKKNEDKLLHLVEALSATPLPQVKHAFEDLVQRFPGRPFSLAAAKAIAAFDASHPDEGQVASLAGDLETFELPSLLQSLGVSEVSGTLTLRDRRGQIVGTMVLDGGKVRSAHVGLVRGDDACYQLFEHPFPGTFAFVKQPDLPPRTDGDPPLRDVVGILLEGMRRYDDFQRYTALVPDDILLGGSAVAPTTQPEEADPALQQQVFSRASSGSTPRQIEDTTPVDGYRVRRLLAYWMEEGSLVPSK